MKACVRRPRGGRRPAQAPTGRSPSPRQSFWLHVHPERVRARTLRPAATLGLGVLSVVLLGVLLVTGVPLMFWYVPAPGLAYDRLVDMSAGGLPVVGLLRDVHRLASDALVVVVALHLGRVYLTGALGKRRRLNWLVGLALWLLVLATAFTGFLLPWDRNAYWAATVGGELLALLPGLGPALRDALWGGGTVSAETVLRAYALHVAALPSLGAALVGYHLFRIRRAGGLARPGAEEPEDLVPTRPAATVRELVLGLAATTALLAGALLWDAPLGPPGDPPAPIDPAKAPWFFLWVQELVSYSAVVGGAVPVLLVLALALAPLGENRPELAGRWMPRARLGRCALFVVVALAVLALTAVAAWLRGPGWALVW